VTGGLSLRNGSRAFAHRNYQLFFGGQATSLVGTWMQTVAQAWLILQLTSDPIWLGLLSALQFLPVMILGLFGGLIADALPKRRTLIVTQVVQMLLAFVLFGLTATGVVQVWHILLLATLLGVTNAVDMPTRQSFVVEMVGREDIANAIALNSAMFNGARIVGPAIAGLTIGLFSLSIAFLINGLSFLAVIIAYLAMRDDDLHSPARYNRPSTVAEVRRTLGEGIGYVRRTEMVLMTTVLVGVVATFGMNFGVMVPALAYDVLHTDATGFGFLMAASGMGALAAALLIAFSGRQRPWMIPAGGILLGVGLVFGASIHVFPLAIPAMVIVGFGAIGMAATANTTIQLAVPDELRGRVISVYTTVFVGSTPVGGLLMGWLASRYGVDASLLVGGIACVLAGFGGLLWLRRIRAASARAAAIEPGRRPSARPRADETGNYS
jgi:MFS family permease